MPNGSHHDAAAHAAAQVAPRLRAAAVTLGELADRSQRLAGRVERLLAGTATDVDRDMVEALQASSRATHAAQRSLMTLAVSLERAA